MVELDIGQSTTTDLTAAVKNFTVTPAVPDQPSKNQETYYDYPEAGTNLGYYDSIPEIKSALKSFAVYIAGQGYEPGPGMDAQLKFISGGGKDTFQQLAMKLIIEKKVFGDAFAEIVRDDKSKKIINLKPLYPGNMRVVWNEAGLIERYEIRTFTEGGKNEKFKPSEILHITNDRMVNSTHGTSIINSLKFIINAKNEALSDERKIRHRELALGVLELDTDDPTKIAKAIKAYENAVANGEVMVTVKGASEIKNNPNQPRDRLQWLQYLDNLFYQVIGIPKVIATSEGYSEAGAKVGIFTFEPIYTSEQRQLEADLLQQAGLDLTFNPPPSLGGTLQSSEAKNTGQTGFQPNDTQLPLNRQ